MTLTTADGGAPLECQAARNAARMGRKATSATTCRMHVSVCKIYVKTPYFRHSWHDIKAQTGWQIRSVCDMRIGLDDNHLTSDQLNVIYSRMAGRYIRRPFAFTPVN